MHDRRIPLCVDLDGTLVRSDLLLESALWLLRRNPLEVFRFIAWWLRGRAHLKQEIARRSALDVTTLPYDRRLLDWLRARAAERPPVLCTASDEHLAEAVAAHLGGFEGVHASNGRRNLGGAAKAALLVERYGEGGFDYAGDAWVDRAVWRRARRAVVVNASPRLVRRLRDEREIERVFERRGAGARTWLAALRVHQWTKNVLVFVPLLAAHLALQPVPVGRALLAFVCFGLCASSAYLINDLFDLEADRRHPRKRTRPFAAGDLPLLHGLLVAPLLGIGAIALGCMLSTVFACVLALYAVTTLAYSMLLKRIAFLDVAALASLYTLRIVAGAIAIPVPASIWLLGFSLFLFLSLAMMKRYTELLGLLGEGGERAHGRGYVVAQLPRIRAFGAASGCLSVGVLAMYIDSAASERLYRHPLLLWSWCPLVLYWIMRAWRVSQRGQMHDDPLVFALTDPITLLLLAICAVAAVAAI